MPFNKWMPLVLSLLSTFACTHKADVDNKEASIENDKAIRSHVKVDEGIGSGLEGSRKFSSEADVPQSKPIIIFMVDGLRPDRFHDAAKKGFVPTLKSLFLDQGGEVESFSPRSLTIPSWSTILTGYEHDETGVRGNREAARKESGAIENFLDYRKDLTLPKYIAMGRSYRQLDRSKLNWLPRYFNKSETLLGFAPLNDGNYPPVLDLILGEIRNIDKVVNNIMPSYTKLDEAASRAIANSIKDNRGKYRYVMVWFSAIDEASHLNNDSLNSGIDYLNVDQGIKRILDAAQGDPVLRDAQLMLVSDHGHRGGYNIGETTEKQGLFTKKVVNTSFNLIKFFAGDMVEGEGYKFKVGAAESPEPDFDLSYLREYLIQPFSYTYEGQNKSNLPGRTVIIDESGASMAQIYLQDPSGIWKTDQMSYHQLSHFKSPSVVGTKDLAADLLSVKLKTLATVHPDLQKIILNNSHGGHPVQLFTCILAGEKAKETADGLVPGLGKSSRPPVLVKSFPDRSALILTQTSPDGTDYFRYLVLKKFSQNALGQVSGEISHDPSDDPLNYSGNISVAEGSLEKTWRTDRQWLKISKQTEMPTAIFSIVRSLTNSKRLQNESFAKIQVPDIVVYANRGFGFHGSDYQESDHGGLYDEEVKNSFFISGIGQRKPKKFFKLKGEFLTRDFAPTVLEAVGKFSSARKTKGTSLFGAYEQISSESP